MKPTSRRISCGLLALSLFSLMEARAGLIANLDASSPDVLPDGAVVLNYVAPLTQGSGAAEITVPGAWTNSLTINSAVVLQELKAFQGNGRVKMDVSMAAPPAGWFQIHVAFQGDGLGWTQINDVMGSGTAFDGTIELDFSQLNLASVPEAPTWGQMILMTNTGQPHTVKIDNIRVVSPEAPKPAAAYVFDTTTEGYGKPAAAYSPLFGGSLAVTSPADTWEWHTDRSGMGVEMTAKLQEAATNGGHFSVDVFGPAGTLAGFTFSAFIQPWNTWAWSQTDLTVAALAVEPLDGGMEVARVRVPISAFGATLTSQPGYNHGFGFQRPPGATIYFDNVMVTPSASRKIDFATGLENFVQETGSTAAHVAAPGSGALQMETPEDPAWGARAFFSAEAGGKVAEMHASLQKAAVTGGTLRFKIYEPYLIDKTENFTGMYVSAGLNGTEPQLLEPLWVGADEFTEGAADATPPGFVRTVSIPLYPAGSTQIDGFVLSQNAGIYEFMVGTNMSGAGLAGLYLDDFEIVAPADPAIIHLPTLPNGNGAIIGRVLTNSEGDCSYAAVNLPPGVVINPATGLVTGAPTQDGNYEITFSVTSGGVTASESLVWVVSSGASGVVITSFTHSGGSVTLTWSGSTAVTVQRSTTMTAGSWEAISTGDADGTHTDSSPPAGRAFYRVLTP